MRYSAMSSTFDAPSFLKTLTAKPGVYQMLGKEESILYVGKAKNLKKRVSSYFQKTTSTKTRVLMQQVVDIRIIVSRNENEALVLENNLIKTHHPQYNILFRDDKSYPYIYASTKQQFPRLDFYRGARKLPGKFFGPYPSVGAVRATLNLLQKIFLLRSCRDNFFSNRSRPCLQYQIKRCSAPCVGYINEADYQKDFQNAMDFLEGKSEEVLTLLQSRMDEASNNLDFELAAKHRDQVSALRKIQERQYAVRGKRNIDIVVYVEQAGQVCLALLMVRNGSVLGNKNFYPKITLEAGAQKILQAFVEQHYLKETTNFPNIVVTESALEEVDVVQSTIKEVTQHAVEFRHGGQGDIAKWLQMAKTSAEQALALRLANKFHMQEKAQALQLALKLSAPLNRIECFDISHSSGEATVASCVVFNQEGALKNDYRRFNIENIQANDDYAAMHQALMRRYTKLKNEEAKLPDLLLIDGGKGQLTQAENVLEELQIKGVIILAIAKGRSRKAGFETLILSGVKKPLALSPDSQALHLLQQIRDEAHRFAITANRQRVSKARRVSPLEGIDGVGAKRRQALLKYFGGLQAVMSAGVDDLAKVSGISRELAAKIYDALHGD